MPGDYSRTTFNREKHYSGVLKQQGRVELDADDNEQLSIQHYRDETEAIDVIGQSGVPKKNDGFRIGVGPTGQDLTISEGRFYVDGLLCEAEGPTTYTTQPYLPNPESTSLSSPPTSPPGGLEISLANGTYLVYLDAWKREISALDDQDIREVALGGPDTATRLQNVWQVKLLEINQASPPQSVTCKTPMPEFEELNDSSTGKLNARTQPAQPEESACLLPPNTGYTRLENQLYRVEVHTGGTRSQATFKFSRDNASVETTISNIAGNVLSVADLGKDQILNFAPGQWVEIVDNESTLKGLPHPLVQIDTIGPGPNEITLKTSADAFADLDGLKLRRWDQSANANANGVSANLSTWIDLESGIQVRFGAGNYRAGDYWLIPARTATGEIDWPRNEAAGNTPIAQPPEGIIHHYSRLALIRSLGGTLSLIADCRKPFPPLTEICAEDICFDNTACDFEGAQNVQDALDMLCRSHEGPCTFVATPGRSVQAIFDAIPAGGDAEICFQVGLYNLAQPVNVEGKGHLKITGCGSGTRLVARHAEAALKFLSCKSVLVRDVYAETGVARARTTNTDGLNGTLTFFNCNAVNVESVGLKCASAPSRAATCITVRQNAKTGSARIQHCSLSPGNQQTGILLVNVERAQVEDNIIKSERLERVAPDRLLRDTQYRANLRAMLVSDARLGAGQTRRSKANVTFGSGEQTVQFRTDTSLKKAWATVLRQNPATGVDSPRALLAHINRLADRLITDEAFRRGFRPFLNLLNSIIQPDASVASQGITVGGDDVSDVRIINNTIHGVLQGVHVGLSKQVEPSQGHIARAVTISGNTIAVLLPAAAAKRDRHGIFVGNCDSLLIANNHVQLERQLRAERLEVDGIRVWGLLGGRALVTQNHVFSSDGNSKRSFDIGIHIRPIADIRAGQMWLASFNIAPSRQLTVRVMNGAQENNNVP